MFNQYRPATLHHPRYGEGKGQRASDWLVIPLCPDCHQGPQGVHGDRTYLRILKLKEKDLNAWVNERIWKKITSDDTSGS